MHTTTTRTHKHKHTTHSQTHKHNKHKKTKTAAYGGHEATGGVQLFVVLRSAAQPWPPRTAALRLPYSATVGDARRAIERALGVPPEAQQIFHHGKELRYGGGGDKTSGDNAGDKAGDNNTAGDANKNKRGSHDAKTVAEMHWHTGTGLRVYDVRGGPPPYDPPVERDARGRLVEKRA
jgi:hypothetical protein